jgi:isochorismate synthase
MHDSGLDIEGLLCRLERRLLRATRDLDLATGGVISITLASPELAARAFAHLSGEFLYWARPAEGQLRVAMGCCHAMDARGPERLSRLEQGFDGLCGAWRHLDPDGTGLSAQAYMGFAFDPADPMTGVWAGLPNATLRIPALMLEQRGALCGLTFSAVSAGREHTQRQLRGWLALASRLFHALALAQRPMPVGLGHPLTRLQSVPSRGEWSDNVGMTLRAIKQGRLDKAVLMRRVRFSGVPASGVGPILGWLAGEYPECLQFAVNCGTGTLLGGSPERLVRRQGQSVVCDAVAGTLPRAQGPVHPAGNQKLRHEQGLVVRMISEVLGGLCDDVWTPAGPGLLSLSHVRHLWSPVKGRLRAGVSLFELASRLHPTPAVGGAPREAVGPWLRRLGEESRGWYTGALGWVAPDGDGELSVILRCAVLQGRMADLYVGAGIVSGSDPDAEFVETEWKLLTMHEALAQSRAAVRRAAHSLPLAAQDWAMAPPKPSALS